MTEVRPSEAPQSGRPPSQWRVINDLRSEPSGRESLALGATSVGFAVVLPWLGTSTFQPIFAIIGGVGLWFGLATLMVRPRPRAQALMTAWAGIVLSAIGTFVAVYATVASVLLFVGIQVPGLPFQPLAASHSTLSGQDIATASDEQRALSLGIAELATPFMAEVNELGRCPLDLDDRMLKALDQVMLSLPADSHYTYQVMTLGTSCTVTLFGGKFNQTATLNGGAAATP